AHPTRHGSRAIQVLLTPARKRLCLEVVPLGARDVAGDLAVDLVDGRLEIRAFGEREQLDPLGWGARGVCKSRVEHHFVLAAGLAETAVPDEVARPVVVLAHASPH